MSDTMDRAPLDTTRATSLVDTIEKALAECIREDGQGFKATVGLLQPLWPRPPVLSNVRTIAAWVAMALADAAKE